MSKLLKNIGVYFAVNLVSQAAALLLWVIIARILPPAQIGAYALAMFVVDFFGAIALSGMQSAVTRFYHGDEPVEKVFPRALLIVLAASMLAAALLFMFREVIVRLIPGVSPLVQGDLPLFGGIVMLSSFYNFGLAHYAALRKAKWYGAVSLLQTAVFFACSLAFLAIGFQITGVIAALGISYGLSAILFMAKEAAKISFSSVSLQVLAPLLRYGIPIMLYSVFGTIVMYAGRIFLDRYASLETLGVYSFFLVIALQVSAVWATVNRAWTPEIFSLLRDNRREALSRVVSAAFLAALGYLLCLIAVAAAQATGLLALILKPAYLSGISTFYLLLLGPLFTGIYTAAYPLFYYRQKTRRIMAVSLALNLVDIALTFLLVRSMGERGAAIGYSISSVISLVAFLLLFQEDRDVSRRLLALSVMLAGFMGAGAGVLVAFPRVPSFLAVVVLAILAVLWYGGIGKWRDTLRAVSGG